MNKRAKITLMASFAAFAASLYALAAAAAYRPYVIQPAPNVTVSATDAASEPQPPEEPSESAPNEPYRTKIIRLHRGKVAVFEEGTEAPIKLLPTDVAQLPDNAVERLKEGVYAYTAEQYRNYIEDFS